MAKQTSVIPAAWSGKVIHIVNVKKCVPGKFAEKKWNALKTGMTVAAYLALEAKAPMDKKNWGKAEIQHYLAKGFIKLADPGAMAGGKEAKESMITLKIPGDRKLLAAVGKVALRSSLLDLVMRMTIKVITGVSVEDALRATARTPSRVLRERVRTLARQELGDGAAFLELEAILCLAENAAENRNKLIHSDWVLDENGNPVVQDPLQGRLPVPTVSELDGLADQIERIYGVLNHSRLNGSLRQAIDAKTKKG